jgi:hypothetical protein
MTRLCFKLALPVVVTFTILAVVARALGNTQPPNPVIVGFTTGCENKPQPCWNGIVPGVTTVNEAIEILQTSGWDVSRIEISSDVGFTAKKTGDETCSAETNQVVSEGGPIWRYDVTCASWRVGDFLALLGKPQAIASCGEGEVPLIIYKGTIRVGNQFSAPSPFQWVDPFNQVIYVELQQSGDYRNSEGWHGFLTEWRYEELEPSTIYSACG